MPKASVVALATALLLSACEQTAGGVFKAGGFRKPPQTIAVAGGSVVIGGPPGFCIDRRASRPGGDTAFVLLGSCASIARDLRAGAPPVLALLTASVGARTGAGSETEATLAALQRFLATPTGRATLARDGQAGSVSILQSQTEQNAVLIELLDSSENPTPGLGDTYWRGFFDLNGRLITLSVIGFADQPVSADTGLAMLRAFLTRIRRETPVQNTGFARRNSGRAA